MKRYGAEKAEVLHKKKQGTSSCISHHGVTWYLVKLPPKWGVTNVYDPELPQLSFCYGNAVNSNVAG